MPDGTVLRKRDVNPLRLVAVRMRSARGQTGTRGSGHSTAHVPHFPRGYRTAAEKEEIVIRDPSSPFVTGERKGGAFTQ